MLLVVFALLVGEQPLPRFDFSPSHVTQGAAVALSWSVPGFDSVFITGLGVVPASGTRRLQPDRDQHVVLVAPDRDGRRLTLSADLTVDAMDRGSESPSSVAFVIRQTFAVTGRDLFQVLGRIDGVLQHDFEYSAPDWVRQPTGVWVITTELKERPDMVLRSEPRVGLRRLAYRIMVNPKAGDPNEFQCEIASAVQTRNRIERQFYPEQSDTLYRLAITKLSRSLGWEK